MWGIAVLHPFAIKEELGGHKKGAESQDRKKLWVSLCARQWRRLSTHALISAGHLLWRLGSSFPFNS
jgi:hypothetical protein